MFRGYMNRLAGPTMHALAIRIEPNTLTPLHAENSRAINTQQPNAPNVRGGLRLELVHGLALGGGDARGPRLARSPW